ncbi:RMD1 family protein [Legionella gresilensis]|uniref:RMD1 family protein n=1 Tax=Legionella gresilensis TaxID=91823 RepID=UPI001F5EACC6|nr:RMD1 family protein [Legionella gresilensis]
MCKVFAVMECLSYCIANSIDLTRLDHYFKSSANYYPTTKSRDVLRISPVKLPNSTIFAFKNGTVVTWGIKRYQVDPYLDKIRQFAIRPISVLVRDEFTYRVSDKTSIEPHGFFDVDCISLDADMDSDELKLSLSYGFSQSVKLQYFETIIEALIEKYSPVIQALSTTGQMQIPRMQIRQIIGEILGAKSEMNLISNFLYHPKYFWQHPTLEEYYTMLERYLHIQRRVNAINHRLDTLNEIFEMFNSYLENRHSHNLEIIIIILITIEIIFAVLNFHF